MKRIILFIVFYTCVAIAQNWTSVLETDVWVGTNQFPGVDIFSNGSGIHIIVQREDELKYYRMNAEGEVIDSVEIESTSVISPSITGDASVIYIVYRKNNEDYIRVKYSNNGGNSWHSVASNPTNSDADFIESIMSNSKLHVTYQVSTTCYYRNFYNNFWSSEYTVSSGEAGVIPRIATWHTVDDDLVYFLYKKQYTSDMKWREFDVSTGTWTSSPKLAISYYGSFPAGFAVTESRISFYYNIWDGEYWDFQWIIKNKSNNSTITTCYPPDRTVDQILYTTVTSDHNVHVPLWYNFSWNEEEGSYPGFYHSNGYDCTLTEIHTDLEQYQENVHYLNCSSSSNDVYVIWQDEDASPNLRLIYDDQYPLAPTGLTITEDANNHPELNWDTNPEPDRDIYKVYRLDSYGGGWQYLDETTNTTYTDETVSYCHAIPPATCPDLRNISYRVTVVDIGTHESDPSNVVTARLAGSPPSKANANDPNTENPSEYSLKQNFPNPFNPSTTIEYSIKKSGNVSLKVYDMIGNEVANLVNENQEAGNYTLEFNAENLPSGIYVYRITSGNFVETKKLILLK